MNVARVLSAAAGGPLPCRGLSRAGPTDLQEAHDDTCRHVASQTPPPDNRRTSGHTESRSLSALSCARLLSHQRTLPPPRCRRLQPGTAAVKIDRSPAGRCTSPAAQSLPRERPRTGTRPPGRCQTRAAAAPRASAVHPPPPADPLPGRRFRVRICWNFGYRKARNVCLQGRRKY